MVEFPRRVHQPGGGVHHRLESFQLVLWNAGESGVPIVRTRQDERRHQGLDDGSGKRPANGSQLYAKHKETVFVTCDRCAGLARVCLMLQN